jgi:DNA gyrase subunit B
LPRKYDDNSIQSLKGADRVRKRPAVIFGSDGLEGCCQSVFEILSNAIDEAREGYGNRITLTQYRDDSIEVDDLGRGIPVGFNEKENEYNWKLLFCELYAGGKYKNNAGGMYSYSLGVNGLGLCATQYASEYMDVRIVRDGNEYTLRFEHGEPVGGLHEKKAPGKHTGSSIKWRPDLEVFTDISIPEEYFEDVLKKQSIVNAGVTFIYRRENEDGRFSEKHYCYPEGIRDYIKEIAGDDTLCPIQYVEADRSGRDREDKPEYTVKISTAFTFSNKVQDIEYYHNSSFLEHGGSPDRAVKSAFTGQINSYIKDKKLYKKDESAITFQDVADCLVLVSSSFSSETSYENQTKKAITNKFIAQAMTEVLRQYLETFFIENPADADRIANQVLINKRSRENAERTRQNLKKTMQNNIDITNRIEKFVDCRSRDPSERELYIVEGDSALGACKQARNAQFQAIMPVRGKILNCLKADYGRIFKSEIIIDLVKVLGCGVAVPAKKGAKDTFNIDNLRWNKVIICTDADYDGYQIRTLILTMIYRLMPKLIDEGYVYIAETPLYEITCGEKTYFAYTDAEKNAALEKIGKKQCTIQRSKGLGENEPDMMWMTTMNPETRRLIKILPDDPVKTAETFELFEGDNLSGRKDYIAEHGSEYLDELDLS